jgi:(S)-ureidoglycine aminohydrolase
MQTRGIRGRAYTLLTPDNHYISRLPSLPGVELVKLVSPRLAPARIAQTLLRIPPAGVRATIDTELETFLFGLSGELTVTCNGGDAPLGPRRFAYLPAGTSVELRGPEAAQLLWITRPYERWPGLDLPPAVAGDAEAVTATETATPGLRRRELLDPDDPRRDFTISLMAFASGVGLPQIEIHDEEHGLYMTRGSGVYTLEREDHEVRAGDFIYMAPYCPQGFAAGAEGAEYLLYKDVFRTGSAITPA